jgi:CRISPR-associated protein Cas1
VQIIIDTADTTITVKNTCFFIENKTASRQISPKRISSIAITTNVMLNSSAIKLAANHQVPIMFFNNFGTIQARLWSPHFVNLAELRKKQYLFSMSTPATDWVIEILKKKTQEQVINLKRLAKEQLAYNDEVLQATNQINSIFSKTETIKNQQIEMVRNQLMGYEGSISCIYFQSLNLFLPTEFKFERRSRRPAMDYFNASLNYLYGMTYSVVESGIFAKGLDPMVGLLHVDNYKNLTLAFDLIEPIRPIIDRILIELILENRLLPEYFIQKEQGYWVGKKGKRIIISSFNDFLQTKIDIQRSTRRLKDHIYMESNQLGNLINQTIEII